MRKETRGRKGMDRTKKGRNCNHMASNGAKISRFLSKRQTVDPGCQYLLRQKKNDGDDEC